MEIERKFLLKTLPQLKDLRMEKIRQGYLCFETDREVRIREKGGIFYLCYKKGAGLQRTEVEFSINKKEFDLLWEETNGRRLEKKRYYLEQQGYLLEIDIYAGILEGLNVVEVEFDSVEESRQFIIPDFFGRELTDDIRYRNRTLIFKGLPGK